MTKTKIERPDLLEIAAMRARWKEERAAGATGETFARWRVRMQKCSTNSAKSLMTNGADAPIRASAISASRSGVNALAQCSHGKGLAGPGEGLLRYSARFGVSKFLGGGMRGPPAKIPPFSAWPPRSSKKMS